MEEERRPRELATTAERPGAEREMIEPRLPSRARQVESGARREQHRSKIAGRRPREAATTKFVQQR